jgi:predicted Fe-Mo cluster-binding NifX family protein
MKKIAFPTQDGQTISAHIGGAKFFLVVTVDDEGHLHSEQRSKPVHAHGVGEDASQPDERCKAITRAEKMLANVDDCQVLISRGLGQSAYQRAQSLGMEILLVAEKAIPAAVAAYRAGALVSDLRRVHMHKEVQ